MIKHHEGALTMVDVLMKSYGAAQDDDVYRFVVGRVRGSDDRDRSDEADARWRGIRMKKRTDTARAPTRERPPPVPRGGRILGRGRTDDRRGVRAEVDAGDAGAARGSSRHAACGAADATDAAPPPAASQRRLHRRRPRRVRPRPPRRCAAAPGGRGGRGGTPPPPPPPPPAVMPAPVAPIISGTPPTPDPRVGLKAGIWDAGQAAWNIKLISTTPPGPKVLGATHSDLAFTGNYAIQGNYNGFEIYDISNPSKPVLVNQYLCPASQNDVSVYKNLLFMSSEAGNSRADCGFGGVPDPISKERVRGIRIFDIKDVEESEARDERADLPRLAHAHRRHAAERQGKRLHLRLRARPACVRPRKCRAASDTGADAADPNNARFRLEVIKVPLAAPEKAAIFNAARIFQGLPVRAAQPRA